MLDLVREIEDTAAWLEAKAEQMGTLISHTRMAAMAKQAVADLARMKGRACLLRQALIQAGERKPVGDTR